MRIHEMHLDVMMYALIAGATSSVVQASPPEVEGVRLYAPCVVCHQPHATGSVDGTIPALAGQQQRYLERQLAVFRSGARYDTAMQIVTVHSTFSAPRGAGALAEYLSVLQANATPVTGSGEHLREGQELYTHICAACHGSDGFGQSGGVPRLAGQHYPYLRQQIEGAANLHTDLAPPEMTAALSGMRGQEKDALADYISRLGSSGSQREPERRPKVSHPERDTSLR